MSSQSFIYAQLSKEQSSVEAACGVFECKIRFGQGRVELAYLLPFCFVSEHSPSGKVKPQHPPIPMRGSPICEASGIQPGLGVMEQAPLHPSCGGDGSGRSGGTGSSMGTGGDAREQWENGDVVIPLICLSAAGAGG